MIQLVEFVDLNFFRRDTTNTPGNEPQGHLLLFLLFHPLYIALVIKFSLLPKCILDLTLPDLSHCCYHCSGLYALDLEIYTHPLFPKLPSPDPPYKCTLGSSS